MSRMMLNLRRWRQIPVLDFDHYEAEPNTPTPLDFARGSVAVVRPHHVQAQGETDNVSTAGELYILTWPPPSLIFCFHFCVASGSFCVHNSSASQLEPMCANATKVQNLNV